MKKSILLTLFILSVSLLISKHSDDFLIGDYSQVYYPEYMSYMRRAGFNNLRVNTESWFFKDRKISYSEMVKRMNLSQVDIVLGDKSLEGPYYSSFGSYYKFEAEYALKKGDYPSRPENEDWFYGIEYGEGANVVIRKDGKNKVLNCSPNPQKDGYFAVNNIKVRESMTSTWVAGKPVDYLTGIMLNPPDTTLIHTIYLRYKVKSTGADKGILFEPGLKLAVRMNSGINFEFDASSLLKSSNPSLYQGKTIDLNQYKRVKPEPNQYVVFEYEVNLNQLKTALKQQGADLETYWDGKILYLSPTLYYQNNGTLSLDYIEVEDNLHRELKDSASPRSVALQKSLQEISLINQKEGNIVYLEARDEPLPSQFDSYQMIDQLASKYKMNLVTAVNCYGMNHADNDRYDLMKHFYKSTHSKVLSPDFYLYGNEKKIYNNMPDKNDLYSKHIQTLISNMCNHYRRTKMSMNQKDSVRFIPVVQTFGQWSKKGYWNGIMLSPDAQQKMIMFLPLCYGIDGLFTYRMMANTELNDLEPVTPETGAYTRVDQGDNDAIVAPINKINSKIKTQSQYEVIREALFNIKKIGLILKNTSWKSGGTIQTEDLIIPEIKKSSVTITASVSTESDDKEKTPDYVGFVEYGAYLDKKNQLYLLLVNRRTNKRILGEEGKPVSQLDVNTAFSTASAQYVWLTISKLPPNWEVYNEISKVSYEYSATKDAYKIPIEAGDGLLVKIGKRNYRKF